MSVLNPGTTFSNGEQLTADLLNDLVSQATFTDASIDNQSTEISGASIIVKDEGIIGSKIATGAVVFTKLAPAMVNNSNTMSDASSTTLATSGSIKQYVDTSIANIPSPFSPSTYIGGESVTLPNKLIMKMGYKGGSNGTITYDTAFPGAVVSICLTCVDEGAQSANATITSLSTTSFSYEAATFTNGIFWQVIGY